MHSALRRYSGLTPLLLLLLWTGIAGCSDRFPPPTDAGQTPAPSNDKLLLCRKNHSDYMISEMNAGDSSERSLGTGLLLRYDRRSRAMIIVEHPFQQGQGGPGPQLLIGYPDSATRTPLPGVGGEIIDAQLVAMSPTGRNVAYIVHTKVPRDSAMLRIFDMETNTVTNLPLVGALTGLGGYTRPSFSPDGRYVTLFGPTDDGSYTSALWLIPVNDLSKTSTLPITTIGGAGWRAEDDFACAWSPDGRRIAFVAEEDAGGLTGQIIIVDTNGWKLVSQMPESFNPFLIDLAWSPDGARLATTSQSLLDQTFDLWLLDVDRGDITRLTSDTAEEHLPDWHPDGTRISYIVGGPFDYRHPGMLRSMSVAAGTHLSTVLTGDVVTAFWE
jgi:Tol biopolymer transport system component